MRNETVIDEAVIDEMLKVSETDRTQMSLGKFEFDCIYINLIEFS